MWRAVAGAAVAFAGMGLHSATLKLLYATGYFLYLVGERVGTPKGHVAEKGVRLHHNVALAGYGLFAFAPGGAEVLTLP